MELATSSQRFKVVHSLQFRLLAAFTLVILVVVGAIYLFVNQTTEGEIRRGMASEASKPALEEWHSSCTVITASRETGREFNPMWSSGGASMNDGSY